MCNQEQTTAARMEALFKRFYRPLYLYALTFLRDEDQAKDITGGVFQTVWEMLREHGPLHTSATGYRSP